MIMKKILMLMVAFSLVLTFPGYGQVNNKTGQKEVRSIVTNQYTTLNESGITKAPRGRVLSSATLQISDEGGGILGVYADTLCHVSVKELQMVIYLDVWNESRRDWQSVDSYRYSWKASDDSLNMAVVSFDLEGLNGGRIYRLRALHSAKSFDNISETMTTETTGIELN